MNKELLITLLLLPLSAFAHNWTFCPTSGTLEFNMQDSKSSSATVKMKGQTTRSIVYVDANAAQQTATVTCINIHTDVTPVFSSSIVNWIANKNNVYNNTPTPITPDYASASNYFNANVTSNANANNFAINTPNSLMVGVGGELKYTSPANDIYSCQHVFIGIGGTLGDGYNWWVFNNAPNAPAHSLSCTDQNGNLTTLYLGTNSNDFQFWDINQQDYVMTFGTSNTLENSYNAVSYQEVN